MVQTKMTRSVTPTPLGLQLWLLGRHVTQVPVHNATPLAAARAGIAREPVVFSYNASMTARSLIERLAAAVGPQGLITNPRDADPHVKDWRGLDHGTTP